MSSAGLEGASENRRLMADTPDAIVLKRHRDLKSPAFTRAVRWTVLGLVAVFLILGLLNVFGQRPQKLHGENARAKLEIYAPSRVRGGVLFEGRFTIYAREELK